MHSKRSIDIFKMLNFIQFRVLPKASSSCFNNTDLNSELMALEIFPFMQYNSQTISFLSTFYAKYCSKDIDERLKSTVMAYASMFI